MELSSLVNRLGNLYRGHSIHAFHQISVHSGKWSQRRRFFRNQPIRNKNGLWRPCLLTDRDEMSNLYRGPSIDASYQIPVTLLFGLQFYLSTIKKTQSRIRVRVFNATFNNISVILWRSVILMEETGIPREKNTDLSQVTWPPLSHKVVSSTPRLSEIRTHNINGDRHWLHI